MWIDDWRGWHRCPVPQCPSPYPARPFPLAPHQPRGSPKTPQAPQATLPLASDQACHLGLVPVYSHNLIRTYPVACRPVSKTILNPDQRLLRLLPPKEKDWLEASRFAGSEPDPISPVVPYVSLHLLTMYILISHPSHDSKLQCT